VRYAGFDDFGSTWLATGDDPAGEKCTGYDAPGGAGDLDGSVTWETLTLGPENVFSDYTSNFRSAGTAAKATTDLKYAYGIDDGDTPVTNGKYIYFIVSLGRVHGGTGNSTIYVRVPWTGKWNYIRSVEVTKLTWESGVDKGNYLTQAEAINVGDRAAWNAALLKRSDLELTVYYNDIAEPKVRDISYFLRAYDLGWAGVINEPLDTLLMDSSEEGFGELLLGYYTSAPDNTVPRDPFGEGDFINKAVVKLPIATFIEGSGFLGKAPNATEPNDLDFIVPSNKTVGTAPTGPVSGWTGAIRAGSPQLAAIQHTYDFKGRFTLPASLGGGTVEDVLIPGSNFKYNFFTGTPLRGSNEIEEVEVTFVVPNERNMVNPGGLSPALAKQYSLYVGEEGVFNAKVYPWVYDQW